MKSYPSISKEIVKGIKIFAQDKLDGSNIRVEWTKKAGFNKFGSRNKLIDETDLLLGKAPILFMEKYSEDLEKVCRKRRWEKVTFFLEFWGPNSFAGNHSEGDEHTLTLFDAHPYKKAFLPPKEFYKTFGHLDVVPCLYEGRCTPDLVDAVQSGELLGMTFEGVICKGKIDRKTRQPVMFKIKNRAWLEKLKNYCGEDESLFHKLA